jgi:hypothetical protein
MGFDDLVNGVQELCLSTFGEEVQLIYKPAAGGSFPIRGVFDKSYRLLTPTKGSQVSSTHPVLGVKAADLPPGAPGKNDQVVVKATTTYKVVEPQPDGRGWILLILQKL